MGSYSTGYKRTQYSSYIKREKEIEREREIEGYKETEIIRERERGW